MVNRMSGSNEPCRLCFNKIYQKCDFISSNEKDMVQIILPEVNLEICENMILCNTCSSLVEESFIFKSTCLEIEDNIHSYVNEKVQADLEKLIGLKDIDGCQRQKICRTCLNIIDDEEVYDLGCENDNLLVHMLRKCLPEIDLQLTKQPALCESCKFKLKKSYSFVCQCMENEEKILEFQKNSNGRILDLFEAVSVLSSKKENAILEIDISNILGSPNRSSENQNFEYDATEKIQNEEDNNHLPLVPVPGISETDDVVLNYDDFINPKSSSSTHTQLENGLSQTDEIDFDRNKSTELELAPSSSYDQTNGSASCSAQAQPKNIPDIISQTDNMVDEDDSPEIQFISSPKNQSADDVSQTSKNSGEKNNTSELEVVSFKKNGEEIFTISDDDEEEVSDAFVKINTNCTYNTRKRTRKKISDDYGFREDLDNNAADPDFNPDNHDLSNDDVSEPEAGKTGKKTKKRTRMFNQRKNYIHCKYCLSSKKTKESSLAEHLAICGAAIKLRETEQPNLRDYKTITEHGKIVKKPAKPKVPEDRLWKRLHLIQESLKCLGELQKHKKNKKKKKNGNKTKESELQDISMQVEATPVASNQMIDVAVNSTPNNSLIAQKSTRTQKSIVSSHENARIVLPPAEIEIVSEANISHKCSEDQNKNKTDESFVVEDTNSTNKSLSTSDSAMFRTSILNHEELCVLKCNSCQFNSRFYDTMEKHIASHFEPFGNCYSCVCTKNFQDSKELYNHLKNVHDQINYTKFYWCVQCSLVFVAHSQLKEHMSKCPSQNKVMVKLFKSNKMIFCMICDFETMNLGEAKRHRRKCHFREVTVVGHTIEID